MPRATVHAVGDVSFTRDIATYVHRRRGGDYTYPLSFVKPELSAADVTLANLETTVRPASATSRPAYPQNRFHFSSKPEALEGLTKNGINIVNLANNHIHDFGDLGTNTTTRLVKNAGLSYIGTESVPYKTYEIRGIRVGILGASMPFTTLQPKLQTSNINIVNTGDRRYTNIIHQLRRLRETVDVVIITIHWGTEYKQQPCPYQKRLARVCIANGADVVIGHHPHVMQTMEHVHVGQRKGTVFYSLGNFLFDSHVRTGGVRNTVILRIHIDKTKGGRVDLSFEYMPCVIHPEMGFAPIPTSKDFLKVYPPIVTKEGEKLGRYIRCAREAKCDKK